MKKKIVYVDMDNVLVDFASAFGNVDPLLFETYAGHIDDIPHNGAKDFAGELIVFGGEEFPHWNSVLEYMGRFAT